MGGGASQQRTGDACRPFFLPQNKVQDDQASSVDAVPDVILARGGEVADEMLEKDLGSLSNEVIQQKFDAMKTMLDKMTGTSPVLKAFQETFIAISPVIEGVVSLTIPFPGGHVVAAAIQIAAMMVKGAINVQACRLLALRNNQLLSRIYLSRRKTTTKAWDDSMKQAFKEFLKTSMKVHSFIVSILKQGWLKKVANWKVTKAELSDLHTDLERADSDLAHCAAVGTYDIFAAAEAERKRVASEIKAKGGMKGLIDDEARLSSFIEKQGGSVGGLSLCVMVKYNSEVIKIGKTLERLVELTEAKPRFEDGIANVIRHARLRQFWARNFRDSDNKVMESVSWGKFSTAFVQSDLLSPEDLQLIDMPAFKNTLDGEGNESVTALELNTAFPSEEVSLLQQIRILTDPNVSPRIRGIMQLPRAPPPLEEVFGREAEYIQMLELLEESNPTRVIVIKGGPGEGKLTVGSLALHTLHKQNKARGGIWHCKLSGVNSHNDVLQRILEGVTLHGGVVANPQGSADGGGGGSMPPLKTRLTQLADTRAPVFIAFDEVFEDHLNPWDLENYLIGPSVLGWMTNLVPMLKVVIMTRRDLDVTDLSRHLANNGGAGIHILELPPLPTPDASAILRHFFPELTSLVSERIAEAYDCNPMILEVIGAALRNKRTTPAKLLGLEATNGVASRRLVMDVLAQTKNVVTTLLSSFNILDQTMIVQLALLFPGAFDLKAASAVLLRPAPNLVGPISTLLECSLVREEIENELLHITPVVRATAEQFSMDDLTVKKFSLGSELMTDMRLRFVKYCSNLMRDNFKSYKSDPATTYNVVIRNRANVHQALRLALLDRELVGKDLVKKALPDLLGILRLVAYPPFAGVHDGGFLVRVCLAIEKILKSKDIANRGLCMAVRASVMPGMNTDEQKEIVKLADEVADLLCGPPEKGSSAGGILGSSPRLSADGVSTNNLTVAMALRRKGIVLRDSGSKGLNEAISALQRAKCLVKSCGLRTDQALMEEILVTAELAGTLDYKTMDPDLGEEAIEALKLGKALAEEALGLAKANFGPSSPHPVTAQCMNYLGFFLKAEGKHDDAITINEKAMAFRCSTLKPRHLEVALSLQQIGISQVFLNRFKEAEKSLSDSLRIRKAALDPNHLLIYNTHRELAKLYREWKQKPAEQEEHLRRQVEIGEVCFNPGHEKPLAAARELVALLDKSGRGEMASAYEDVHVAPFL